MEIINTKSLLDLQSELFVQVDNNVLKLRFQSHFNLDDIFVYFVRNYE